MSLINATETEYIVGLLDLTLESNLGQTSADNTWMILCAVLVFFMHAGFTMLEAGSVTTNSAVNILFKNVGTIALGSLMWYFFGWSFAYGIGNDETLVADGAVVEGFALGKFVGTGAYALATTGISDTALIFFQMMFCATAATIVSGAVAGRVALPAYFCIAAWLTGFVYPVVAHVGWATGGWLSSFNGDCAAAGECAIYGGGDSGGVIDFAGSGIVHMTGGVAAFWAALLLGPRIGRFAEGGAAKYAPHNIGLQALGVFILWFGWYGFNCGSTLVMDGDTAGQVAVTTTLAPAAAVVAGIITTKIVTKTWDIGAVMNGALAGLVSITAPCGNVSDGNAILIGAIGFFVYYGASKLLKLVKIDDPVDAIAVHGFCGMWGVLAAGLFDINSVDGISGIVMETQIMLILFVILWVSATMLPLLVALKVTGKLRVSEEDESAGLDSSEHGGSKIAFAI